MSISLKDNMLKVFHHESPDYMPLRSDMDTIFCAETCETAGTESQPAQEDIFGRRWIYEPKVKGRCPDVNHPLITDITAWRSVMRFPDLRTLVDWNAWTARCEANIDRENKLLRFNGGSGMWEYLFNSMNFVDALTSLLEEPEACEEFFAAVADFKIQLFELVIAHIHPDVITMHEDYGSGNGLFMSPAVWRQLIKPQLKRVVDFCRDKGVIYQHHNCGYMVPLLDDMVDDLGIQSWQKVHICNDPVAVYQKYGDRFTLMDGILDEQLVAKDDATDEEIRCMVKKTVDAICPGGASVVLSASTALHPERDAVVTDALLEFGQKYYREKRPEGVENGQGYK